MSNTMIPDLAVRRQMLEQKIAEFKAQGYGLFLDAEAAKVQDPGPSKQAKDALREHVANLEAQSANAYAAAKRLQAMLDELPVEEAKAHAD